MTDGIENKFVFHATYEILYLSTYDRICCGTVTLHVANTQWRRVQQHLWKEEKKNW